MDAKVHPDVRPGYDEVDEVAKFLMTKTEINPRIGIICGSGLGGLVDNLDSDKPKNVIPYEDIPGFPKTTVQGHAGNLVFGYLSGKPTVCMQGRLHFYEGHPPWKITVPVRVFKLLGVEVLIVTNAAGGLTPECSAGSIMMMKDHINFAGMAGQNPLIGPNEDRFGPRFPPMTSAYDPELRELCRKTAKELNMTEFFREGVYVHLSGPSYETPAESRFLRIMGADAVGMSTAPEVVVARHCDIKVLGLSLVTNDVILDHDSSKVPPCHQEVMEMADKKAKDMRTLVKAVVGKLELSFK